VFFGVEHSLTRPDERAPEAQRAPARTPLAPNVAVVLALQRSAGNAAVNRLLRSPRPTVAHIVAEGERIDQIAAQYGVTVDELSEANQDKLRRWGDTIGFNAGEEIGIPRPLPPEQAQQPTPLQDEGSIVEWALETWDAWFGSRGKAPPVQEGGRGEVPEPQPKNPKLKDPIEVVAHHNAAGTFSQHVTVTSSKRDNQRQLEILRNYCNRNRAGIDTYVAETDWLAGTLDWDAFQSAGLADESVYIPFFFALYYGGGGPGTATDARTLPLVAAPVQTTWADANGRVRTANASPHIAGRAMDADAADLNTLNHELKTKVPEFAADGPFPISSTQVETVDGQTAVHVTFVNPVFD
jgi:hypothetical protein